MQNTTNVFFLQRLLCSPELVPLYCIRLLINLQKLYVIGFGLTKKKLKEVVLRST